MNYSCSFSPCQTSSGVRTETCCVSQNIEGISRTDRNTLKVSEQKEASPSRKLTFSSAPSLLLKQEGAQLEAFQSLTFQPDRNREFGTLQDLCSGLYNTQTLQETQKKTRTEIQTQCKDFSQVVSQEKTNFNTPLQPQYFSQVQIKGISDIPFVRNRENSDNSHSGDAECKIDQSVCKPTASVSKSSRQEGFRHQEMKNTSEAAGKVVDEDEVKGQFEVTASHRNMAATSEDRWEQSHVWTHKHPISVYESNLVQHFNVSPRRRDNKVSPRARRHQEVIVSFKTANDHIERVSSSNMETQSKGSDETKTHLHLSQSSKSRPGSNTGSNQAKVQKQATTKNAFFLTASNNTSPASTPSKCSTFARHSSGRSSRRSSSEDEDNPNSQCQQFPKLHDPHLNPAEDDCFGLAPSFSEAEEMKTHTLKLRPQQQSFNRNNITHGNPSANYFY